MPLTAYHRPLLIALALGLVMLPGCGGGGPETVPVEGTVTLDGQPVEGAQVMLIPDDGRRPGEGRTDSSGQFEISTFGAGDGALVGHHTVTVSLKRVTGLTTNPDGTEGAPAPGGPRVEWIVPRRYSNPDTSGLTADVSHDMEPLGLELTSR